MKKLAAGLSTIALASILLSACTETPTTKTTGNTQVLQQTETSANLNYKIVVDEKFEKTEQREVRITTTDTDYEALTKAIMDAYKGKGLDSLHLYIHEPGGDSFGANKAHSRIAYTQKGVAQTGVEQKNTYIVEISEESDKTGSDNEDQTSKEWQDSFVEIAKGQAGTYIELRERDGSMAADRLEEYSKVVAQQANKIVDEGVKKRLLGISDLIKADKLDEVKAALENL